MERSTVLVFGAAVLIVLSICVAAISTRGSHGHVSICTTEAMRCPDGSYVIRQGINCEFAKCPAASTTTGITEK